MKYTIISNSLFEKFDKLPGKSVCVYLLLKSKVRYQPKTITPISQIVTCTYREAEKTGISRQVFSAGLKVLIKLELIKIVSNGSFKRKKGTRYLIF